MIYRVLINIAFRRESRIIPRGTIGRLDSLTERARRKLLTKGHIARVAPPPLSLLPGIWRFRARRLRRKWGIADGAQLLEADIPDLAGKMSVSETTVRVWRQEVAKFMGGQLEEDGDGTGNGR